MSFSAPDGVPVCEMESSQAYLCGKEVQPERENGIVPDSKSQCDYRHRPVPFTDGTVPGNGCVVFLNANYLLPNDINCLHLHILKNCHVDTIAGLAQFGQIRLLCCNKVI